MPPTPVALIRLRRLRRRARGGRAGSGDVMAVSGMLGDMSSDAAPVAGRLGDWARSQHGDNADIIDRLRTLTSALPDVDDQSAAFLVTGPVPGHAESTITTEI